MVKDPTKREKISTLSTSSPTPPESASTPQSPPREENKDQEIDNDLTECRNLPSGFSCSICRQIYSEFYTKNESHLRLFENNPIRKQYDAAGGATKYYTSHGTEYRNPHEFLLKMALMQSLFHCGSAWITPSDLSRVLDLCCGSGEITLFLRAYAEAHSLCDAVPMVIDGVDPYCHEAYKERTGNTAHRYTFKDIADGALDTLVEKEGAYDLIVCSFAFHLCEKHLFRMCCTALSKIGKKLLIVSPIHLHTLDITRNGWKIVTADTWPEVILLRSVH